MKSDQPILVMGKASKNGDKDAVKILASKIIPLSDADTILTPAIHLSLNLNEINKNQLQQLKKILLNYPGDSQTFLHLVIPQKSDTVISLDNTFKVNPSPQLLDEIKSLFGNALI